MDTTMDNEGHNDVLAAWLHARMWMQLLLAAGCPLPQPNGRTHLPASQHCITAVVVEAAELVTPERQRARAGQALAVQQHLQQQQQHPHPITTRRAEQPARRGTAPPPSLPAPPPAGLPAGRGPAAASSSSQSSSPPLSPSSAAAAAGEHPQRRARHGQAALPAA